MDRNQLDLLKAPFSLEEILERQGSHGRVLKYIQTHSVITRLNEALEGDWSFHIVDHFVREDISEVIVIGKLVVGEIVKMNVGSSSLTRNRQTGEIVSLGDSLKGAASDALKRCSTLLSLGHQLYRSEETVTTHQAVQHSEPPPPTRQSPAPSHGRLHHNTRSHPPQHSRTGTQEQPGSTSRISQKQHSYLLKLASDQGMSKQDLNQQCQNQFGVVLDFISRQDASSLIDQLRQGEQTYGGDVA